MLAHCKCNTGVNDRVDSASAAETVHSCSIPGQVKATIMKLLSACRLGFQL